jgi:tellurite resistance protein/uncharacterized protein (DUF697 family)
MTDSEQQALLSIALLAAFADGNKADAEREAIRTLAESLGKTSSGAGLARLYQDVLLKRVSLADAVNSLGDDGQRQLAYEMAVCVCDADGGRSAAETTFLADLRGCLKLDNAAVAEFEREEQSLVTAANEGMPALAAAPAAAGATTPLAVPASSAALEAELDRMILGSAKLNGALELLPQSWASMAIIPLQVRMVYRIGQAHGVELDQGHIREFIAAVGVGLTSQYIEQFGRKLLGGLIGAAAGRMIGGLGRAATGGLLRRHDLCIGAGGQTLLRRRPGHEHSAAAGDFSGAAGAGQADAGAVVARDATNGQHARCGQGDATRSRRVTPGMNGPNQKNEG